MSQRPDVSSAGTHPVPRKPRPTAKRRVEPEPSSAELVGEVRKTASHVASRATAFVGNQLTAQKRRVAGGVGGIADAIRKTGGTLAENDSVDVRPYLDAAAEQVERLSSYIDERGVDELVEDVEGFARRRPALFFGGALALGFLAARFIKSSDSYARRDARRVLARGTEVV